jgi:hypothetical protein
LTNRCRNCGHAERDHWQEDSENGLGVYTGCNGEDEPAVHCQCTFFEK